MGAARSSDGSAVAGLQPSAIAGPSRLVKSVGPSRENTNELTCWMNGPWMMYRYWN